MKKLEGLKVEALAVEVPTDGYYRSQMVYHIVPQGQLQHITTTGTVRVFLPKLHEGEWQILGRADELRVSEINSIFETKKTLYPNVLEQEWQSYCIANNLTNELILIKK